MKLAEEEKSYKLSGTFKWSLTNPNYLSSNLEMYLNL